MAKTNRIACDENTRLKIKTGMLIKRLTDHIHSETELMTSSQVNAARILLNKSLPDLSNIDIKADIDGEIHITWQK